MTKEAQNNLVGMTRRALVANNSIMSPMTVGP